MSAVFEMLMHGVLLIIALMAVMSCAYLGIAALLSRRIDVPRPSQRTLRFDVIVPAHDEAAVIGSCVAGLRMLNWPSDKFRVIVVADNCKDATLEVARTAGARVLQREDRSRRGKGYALAFAFDCSMREQYADAIVVVDADSQVSTNLLDAFAARIERGAHAIQARYHVSNPGTSARTRLMAIAFAAFHIVRSRARERLGVSCGCRGNGWCVTRTLLERVPYEAFSLAEDIEYGIELGLAGYRVHYADEATVWGEMVSTAGESAKSQRQRWEGGRLALVRSRVLQLLRAGVRTRNVLHFDLAFDLLVPPLSHITLLVVALIVGAALARWWSLVWLGIACGSVVLFYVLRGWQLSGTGAQGLMALMRAPAFVFWKVLLMLRPRRNREWLRTERERS